MRQTPDDALHNGAANHRVPRVVDHLVRDM
jgi:hypothetical protein